MNRKNIAQQIRVISKVKAQKLRIGIVVSRFNGDITEKLYDGAVKILTEYALKKDHIDTVRVPGGFEIPLACQRLARSHRKYDALIAIGCVIRGDTDHYVHIASESTRGTMDVMLRCDIPIANCILTLENLKQAGDRVKKGNNKGAEAAMAVLQMV